MNAAPLEVKNFYALVTLGLNPDGTSSQDRSRNAVASQANATLALPAKKRENA